MVFSTLTVTAKPISVSSILRIGYSRNVPNKCDDLIAAVEQFQDRHDGIQEAVNVLANDVHLIKSKEDSDAWFKRSEELSALIAELEEEASKLEKQQEELDEFREQLLL